MSKDRKVEETSSRERMHHRTGAAEVADRLRSKALPVRTDVGRLGRLQAPEIPGFRCVYINDTPGLVDTMIAKGYVVVEAEDLRTLYGATQLAESTVENILRPVVNTGRDAPCTRAVLMAISNESYDAIFVAEQALQDEKMRAITRQGTDKGLVQGRLSIDDVSV